MQQGSNEFLYLNTSKPVHSQKKPERQSGNTGRAIDIFA